MPLSLVDEATLYGSIASITGYSKVSKNFWSCEGSGHLYIDSVPLSALAATELRRATRQMREMRLVRGVLVLPRLLEMLFGPLLLEWLFYLKFIFFILLIK